MALTTSSDDFDFFMGDWTVRHRRLVGRLVARWAADHCALSVARYADRQPAMGASILA
jgi:hypothetical protein